MAATRTTPTPLGQAETNDMPERTRSGFWKDQMEQVFKPNPGIKYTFKDVSPSTASNLRREYGLNAVAQTVNGELILHVRWDPDKAEQIKRETAERGEKRKATIARNKANGEKTTGTQTAGKRS